MNLVFGFFGGLVTFFIWVATILIYGGPGAAKASAGVFYFGFKLSILMAAILAVVGFFVGQERLVRVFSILWGTDKEFNDRVNKVVYGIPLWFGYVVLSVAIVGSFGYLATLL